MKWKSLLAKPLARYVAARERRSASNALLHQRTILSKLLRAVEGTAFGRDHGLHRGMTATEFRLAVPVRDYEALQPWIQRTVEGESNVLWPGMPLYFCKTSGTTSGEKYIPLTKESMSNHIDSARNALLHFIAETGNTRFLEGQMIFLQGSPLLDQTKGGTPMGRLSGIVAHHVPAYLQANRLPSHTTNCQEPWEAKISAIVEETMHQDLRLISGIPSWVQNYFELLLERTGAACVKEVFPNFELFVYGGVAYESYRSKFKTLIGEDVPTVELYPASEGFFAYQDSQTEPGLRLNVNDGIYFEFIPTDRYFEADPPRLGLDEVELGVQYALILSSNAGLWGYDIGDTIKFVSLDPFRIVVTGRVKHFTSAFGEHVIAEEVEAALQIGMARGGGSVTEFHVAPQVNPSEGLPYHEWLVEFDAVPADMERFGHSVNTAMMDNNPYYRDLIAGNILRPLEVTCLTVGSFHAAMDRMGKLGGQNKPPRLANDRKFAEILLEHLG